MRNESSSTGLIDHALRRLVPDVFCHPIWTHFVAADGTLPLEQRQALLGAVDEMLAAGHVEDACRVFFICTFQCLRAGDTAGAVGDIQRILSLVEQHKLPHVAVCAAWGAAAVSVRSNRYQQAAEYLDHLQSILGQQHDWVLSDAIEIIRQALLSQPETAALDRLWSSDAALAAVLAQLLQWGMPAAVSQASHNNLSHGCERNDTVSAASSSGSSGFHWRSIWQAIKRIATGELQLRWVATTASTLVPPSDELSASFPASRVIAIEPLPEPTSYPLMFDRQSEADRSSAPEQPGSAVESPAQPSITAHLLGAINISVNDAVVQSWPTGKGRAVFKYLLAHHDQPVPRDVLMEVFWPQAGPEAARNSLNVALHGLRQALKTVTDLPVIVFEEGAYGINPEFHIWVDVDEFDHHVQAGRRFEAKEDLAHAITEYDAAIVLYQGDFLSGDLYEEWPVLTRERLRVTHLEVLDRLSQIYFDQKQYAECVTLCKRTLAYDACREDVHGLLMRCYSRQGQRHLALRQYQACVGALRTELEVDPAPETKQLYERIRRRVRV